MIGQYISLKEIIEGIYTDTGAQDSIIYEDLIKWSVEALNKIGHPLQYRRKVTGHKDNPNLTITDYKAPLPNNLHKIEQILVNGQTARYSTDSFHYLLGGECCGLPNTQAQNLTGAVSTGFYIDGFGNEFNSGTFSNASCGNVTYAVNSDCLTLSVKEGDVCIAYLEFPVDEEGLPLIPDEESYREAVTRYLIMKIDYKEWRKNPNSQGNRMLYEDSKTEWAWYVGQAANKAKLHSVDQLESIKNMLVKTFHSFNQHKSGFKGLGEQQHRRIQ
jgi:hypothetical protein